MSQLSAIRMSQKTLDCNYTTQMMPKGLNRPAGEFSEGHGLHLSRAVGGHSNTGRAQTYSTYISE